MRLFISGLGLVSLILLFSCGQNDMALNKKDLDTSTDPGTDFYQYANGGWIKNNPLPP